LAYPKADLTFDNYCSLIPEKSTRKTYSEQSQSQGRKTKELILEKNHNKLSFPLAFSICTRRKNLSFSITSFFFVKSRPDKINHV